jgi:hypothetical protein
MSDNQNTNPPTGNFTLSGTFTFNGVNAVTDFEDLNINVVMHQTEIHRADMQDLLSEELDVRLIQGGLHMQNLRNRVNELENEKLLAARLNSLSNVAVLDLFNQVVSQEPDAYIKAVAEGKCVTQVTEEEIITFVRKLREENWIPALRATDPYVQETIEKYNEAKQMK